MPAYNEEQRLVRTLAELAEHLRAEVGVTVCVFLVDDGSVPPISDDVVPASHALRVVLARHEVNLGQGAAIETARRLALDPRFASEEGAFDAYVTMDSDGQHRPQDVQALALAVTRGVDVALGNRFAGGSDVPSSRRVLLTLARLFERLTTGLTLSDAHNGLRAFSPRAIGRMQLRQNRMAHATEITRRISLASSAGREAERLRLVEVPVAVRYTDESLAKGQKASGAVAIVVDLFQGFLFGKGS
ncbi:Dolichol-phosphate mannosyltransferase [Labilithrix luteola]|uniref:Dolichol-phosphate mannosyltransferase n=2 Tax=Labilithrix luteola TaxID=1391654 RepID=A0A0K1QCG0_9BACT|nr:Dolichol-phosphate mannosyltransferase [Labilithrix luteola]